MIKPLRRDFETNKSDYTMVGFELVKRGRSVPSKYEDYMCNQPMRDGEEIRNFFDSLDDEEE